MVKPFFLLSSVCYVYIYVMRYVYYVNLVVLVGLGTLTQHYLSIFIKQTPNA